MIETVLSFVLFVVLSVAALFHVYWAFGGYWPAVSLDALPRTVIGANGITQMPPAWMTLMISGLIFSAGIVPLVWTGLLSVPVPGSLTLVGMTGLCGVFLLRGGVGFTSYFERMHAEEPFRTLDRLYFSPLCLAIGTGFLVLLLLKSLNKTPAG